MATTNQPQRRPKKPRAKRQFDPLNEIELPDFADPIYPKPFQNYFRSLFMDAVYRQVPEVLQSLRRDVWERLKSAEPDDQVRLFRQWRDEKLTKQFHLPSWVLTFAAVAIKLWSTHEVWLEYPGWPSVSRGFSSSNELPAEETLFRLSGRTWHICEESWSAFKQGEPGGFGKELSAYRKHMISLAERSGFRKTPRKRGRAGRHPYLAFDYLARWQVSEWTSERIAEEFDDDKSLDVTLRAQAVMEQIHWAADVIELPLRPPARPGRPRKGARPK